MNKIITFLGKYPRETQYLFEGQVYTGHVFAEALHQFTDYDQMLVFVTEEARETSWPVLKDLDDPRIEAVSIPLGQTTAEMWVLFEEILDRVEEGDSVVFDITHGLRSTPFLVFLFAAFLKFARSVTIEAVYYGAFELGNAREGVPAPVFDLSEFVNMLDWITATDRFITTGDGQALTELLQEEMPPGVQMGSDLKAREIGKHLKAAANGIQRMSQALRMARPFEALSSGAHVSDVLAASKDSVSARARPFEALAGQIEKTYGQFGLENPLDPNLATKSLIRQLGMVGWYLDHQQAVQATLLMREWLVSALMAVLNVYPFDDREDRFWAEKCFNDANHQLKQHGRQGVNQFSSDLLILPDPAKVVMNWDRVSQLRNDIAHCGHRQNAQDASNLIHAANLIYENLCQMANDILPLVQ
jgi:CRISPR-associated Csx2 family protein